MVTTGFLLVCKVVHHSGQQSTEGGMCHEKSRTAPWAVSHDDYQVAGI